MANNNKLPATVNWHLTTVFFLQTTDNRQLTTVKRSTNSYVRKNNKNMQNKAKFRKVKFYATYVLTRDYDKKDTWWNRKKQSQTKPNKPKPKKAKMNVNKVLTKDYENKSHFAPIAIQSQYKPKQTQFQNVERLLALDSIVSIIIYLE